MGDALGDGVSNWLTLNEPWCAAFLGYGIGRHAPGIHDGQQAVAAAHHLMLAHGLAVQRMRATAAPGTSFGIVLNVEPHMPASGSAADLAAARLADGMHNRIFLDPLLRGRYPEDVLEHLRPARRPRPHPRRRSRGDLDAARRARRELLPPDSPRSAQRAGAGRLVGVAR